MRHKLWLGLIGLGCLTSIGYAQDINLAFTHGEWEIYCSNTGTCRAAGYNNEDGYQFPASILLTRKAGEQEAIRVEVALSAFDEDLPKQKLKNIHFYLNNHDLGQVKFVDTALPLQGYLTSKQTQALLQNVKQKNQIIFKNSDYTWHISDQGMTAVLLKMDDVQKRIGTTGAVVYKGTRDESKVLPAQPKLIVKQVKISDQPFKILQVEGATQRQYHTLRHQLKLNLKDDAQCDEITRSDPQQSIQLYRLSNKKVLATILCWRAAYNEGYGAWLLNENLSGEIKFISDSISDVTVDGLYSAQKGRGIGDCWASSQWIWNGKDFILTENRWTGMCKGFMGGAWQLDLIEADIE